MDTVIGQRDRDHAVTDRGKFIARDAKTAHEAGDLFLPMRAQRTVLLKPDILQAQRPADAEVADSACHGIPAVVGANHLDRDARQRNGQIFERHRKQADFHVAVHHDGDGLALGRPAREVSGHQAQFIRAVQKERRIEGPEFAIGHGRRTSPQHQPIRRAFNEPVL